MNADEASAATQAGKVEQLAAWKSLIYGKIQATASAGGESFICFDCPPEYHESIVAELKFKGFRVYGTKPNRHFRASLHVWWGKGP